MSFLCSLTETTIIIRSVLIVAILLSIAAAYYIYLPLPCTISEPWKLMFMDSVLRGVMHVSFLAHGLGLTIRVTETSFGGVQAQVFESTAADQEPHLKRGVVYFHGGGWTLGSGKMQTYYLQCWSMAEELDGVVISIEYMLAPEARFPDQYNEAVQASKHILTAEVLSLYSIDPKRVAVSGDSAGANLAAAVAQQMALDNSDPIKFKVQALDFNTPSYQQNGHIPILHRLLMARFWLEYLNGDPRLVTSLLANNHTTPTPSQEIAAAKAKTVWTKLLPVAFQKNYKPLLEKLPGLLDVRAVPLLADMKVLKAVPPAYIMTCEHDVLRDDGLMYATRLEEVGVDVTVDHYEDCFHGCLSFAFGPFGFSVGFRSFRNCTRWLKVNL
uniref:Neutral cholesterol ester hydrolase 1 n=1 Tax=Sinocyclocheilus rhinocerous TaxID=307959 RepID=A0A673MXD3_9TELE